MHICVENKRVDFDGYIAFTQLFIHLFYVQTH